jgi:response regulator RpfG family c-di-GMP phosphodiesterase
VRTNLPKWIARRGLFAGNSTVKGGNRNTKSSGNSISGSPTRLPPEATIEKAEAMKKPSRSENNPARILILDDEHDEQCLLSGLTTYLTHSGYVVIQCQSAESAMEEFQQDSVSIDLLISDVTFADSSALKVCLRLREFAPELKLLFLSDRPLIKWKVLEGALFRELPPDSVRILPKPFSALDLLIRVDELIGAAPAAVRTSQAGALS